MEQNSQNFSGMNVTKMQQGRPQPRNGNTGKSILIIVIVLILAGGVYYAWDKYGSKFSSTATKTATSTAPKVDNSTSSGSISEDIDTAGKFDNTANTVAIDQEFK